jgi:hypothetical protein
MLRVVEDGRQHQRRRSQAGTVGSRRRCAKLGAHGRDHGTVI